MLRRPAKKKKVATMPTMAELPMAMATICAVVFAEVGCVVGRCVAVSSPLVSEMVGEMRVVAVVIGDAELEAVICG